MTSDELWRLVEARHDDGTPAMFRIRDLSPRLDQSTIFVVELPYPTTELSRLPDAAAYRRLGQFEEQWVRPAAAALDLTFVAVKTDDGSFFLYLYGAGEPRDLIARLSPFDGALGFFDEHDPGWDEYAALRELLAQAKDLEPEPPSPAPERARPLADTADATIDDAPRTKPRIAAAEKTPAAPGPAAPARGKPAPPRTTRVKTAPAKTASAKTASAKTAPTKPQLVTKQPAAKQPAANKLAANKSTANKLAANKLAANKSTANKSTANKSTANKSTANRSAANKSAANKSAANKRTAKNTPPKNTTAKKKPTAATKSTAKR